MLLKQQSPVSWVNTRSMSVETELRSSQLFSEQRQCNTAEAEIQFFRWGEGKNITNPWMKSADKFKLKRNASNHLKSFNSFEETACPNFRQKDPLEILRDRERQANRFRKIFKQGPVPVSDSVSHRFCVGFFFPFKMLSRKVQKAVAEVERTGKYLHYS